MNQYRCETCNHKDNGWCELLNRILYFNESDFISEVGCASHSDYQSERDTVLDIICEWLRYNDPKGLYHYIKNELQQQAGEQ